MHHCRRQSIAKTPHRIGGKVLAVWLVGLALVASLAQPSRAAEIRPYLNLQAGWTDNLRLRQEAKADYFTKINPGIRAKFAKPGHRFDGWASFTFSQYVEHPDLNGFDTADVGASYAYEASPRWKFNIDDRFTSTFDKPEFGPQGELVTVRDTEGRVDRNTLRGQLSYQYSPFNYIRAAYDITHTMFESKEGDNSVFHRALLVWNHRLQPHWEVQVGSSAVVNDYEQSVDTNRYRIYGKLTRLVGPTLRFWGQVGYVMNRAQSSDTELNTARDYDIIAYSLGIGQSPSERFNWSFSAGWSRVSGDRQGNDAAGEGFPLLNAQAQYRGERWDFRAFATADLGELDFLGDNSGLTVSHRAGISYNYRLTRFHSFFFQADYVRNDFKQDPVLADTSEQGIVHSYRVLTYWKWQFHKHWSLTLEYSYLNRDAEDNDDDRVQNQVILRLGGTYPFRW